MGGGSAKAHLGFLDGVRGVAALYVVLHHIWLTAYPKVDVRSSCELCRDAPAWTHLLVWGQFAVAVFIVVSGFSLALAPLRHGDRLPNGFGDYIYRRGLRIIPPYWVALALSCAAIVYLTGEFSGHVVTGKAVWVHAALVQNLIDTPKPNGAFWSIAIEWQIYFLFPLILLMWRGWGALATLFAVTGAVALMQLAATHHATLAAWLGTQPQNLAPLSKLVHLKAQLLALFVFGVAAAHAGLESSRRGVAWGAYGTLGIIGILVLLRIVPMESVEPNFFWLDLLVGGAVAALFAWMARRPLSWLSSGLGSRVLRWLGESSYSLYLIHVPVLEVIYYLLVRDRVADPDLRFTVLLIIVVPAALLASRVFWRWIEVPCMRHRSIRTFGRPSFAARGP